MLHLPELIQDLGVILATAAVVTLIFKQLKQPVVLGYLIAGVLVGPHFPFIPNVIETKSIQAWAEIGVIFLLFGLGLEFSFKKLAKVGRTASITATVEIAFMLGVGFLTGQSLGWNQMDSIFLGGILAISSTTIIVRAFEGLGLKGRGFVSVVFGVLIVEDLIAILLLVLLSTIAVTQTLAGGELVMAGLRLGFFLLLWFVVGIYAIPIFLRSIRAHLNDETTLVLSIGLCLMMVMIATKVGFSPALGAFVMGSLLAETRDGKRIEHLITPVRDLFAAVFFVSVGMLIDPKVLNEYGLVILLVTVITIFGKFLSSALGSLLSGQSLRHSVQAGMSLAQIGEFSFIIATLGLTLKVTSDFLYPIAVAVSAITTFTTPYMIQRADRFSDWLERNLPKPLLGRLNHYQQAFGDKSSKEDVVSLLWNAYGIKILLNSVVVIGITLAMKKIVLPKFSAQFGSHDWVYVVSGMLSLLFAAPFLWGVILGKPTRLSSRSVKTIERLRTLQFGLTIVRSLLGLALLFFIVAQYSRTGTATAVVLALFGLTLLFFSRFAEPLYRTVEDRFLANLNEKEQAEISRERGVPGLAPWDATLAPFVISSDSELMGKTLEESKIKERFGVTVALIDRGHRRLQAPGRHERLLPGDRVHLIGTEEQFSMVQPVLESVRTEEAPDLSDDFGLHSLRLNHESRFSGSTIRGCGLREAINGLIVGIEREGKRVLNPDSSFVLLPGDLVWLVGENDKIKTLS
jgi:CPA2 family monovalent cation:H+ antiporter-2